MISEASRQDDMLETDESVTYEKELNGKKAAFICGAFSCLSDEISMNSLSYLSWLQLPLQSLYPYTVAQGHSDIHANILGCVNEMQSSSIHSILVKHVNRYRIAL